MVKDIRMAGNTGQALKILNDRIEQLARKSTPEVFARYENQSTDAIGAGNNQLAFLTAVAAHSDVVPVTSGRLAFTLAPGRWLCLAGARVGTSATVGELGIAYGEGASTWTTANTRVIQNIAKNSASAAITVTSTGSTVVTVNVFGGVARALDPSVFAHTTFIEFRRLP